jgi:Pectate lyase superfamily protein
MAVTTTTSSVAYTATGGENSYAVPFRFLEASHLVVTVDGDTKVLGTHYSVLGAGGASGSIVPLVSLAGALVITRVVPLLQPTRFRLAGTFSPRAHEEAFDRSVMQLQQVSTDVAERVAYEAANRTAADAAILAGGAIPANIGIAPFMATSGLQLRTPADRFSDLFNVKDFGAKGDGSTDDTVAIQAAVDAAIVASGTNVLRSTPPVVYFPSGRYMISSTIFIGSPNDGLNANPGTGNKPMRFAVSGYGAVISAKVAIAGAMLHLRYGRYGSGSPVMTRIEGLLLNCESLADFGLVIHACQNLAITDVWVDRPVLDCLYVDGNPDSPPQDLRIVNIMVTSMMANAPGRHGIHLEGKGNMGSYSGFTFVNCAGEGSGSANARIDGAGHVQFIGGTFHTAASYNLDIDNGSSVAVIGSYFHPTGNAYTTRMDHASVLHVSGGAVISGIEFVDAKSKVLKDYANTSGFLDASASRTMLGDFVDTKWFGPPAYPQHPDGGAGSTGPIGTGWVGVPGDIAVDVMGNEWQCITPGVSSNNTFQPKNGRIVIPVRYGTWTNGILWWWPHEDLLITSVRLVITETWVGGTFLQVGGAVAPYEQWLSDTQLAVANLVLGRVIDAKDNAHGQALIGAAGKAVFGPGLGGNYLGIGATDVQVRGFKGGTFTAGKGFLVIECIPLKWGAGLKYEDEAP